MAILNRQVLVYADGHDCAASAPDSLTQGSPSVVVGWLPEAPPWLASDVTGWTMMAGYAATSPIREGRLRYLPTRLSAAGHLLAEMQPDIAVISGVRRGSELAFGKSVGWALSAIECAQRVIVEIDEGADDLGAPLIPGPIARVVTCRRNLTAPVAPIADECDMAIALNVLSVLPNRATLQFGPGSVSDAIIRGLDRPVSIWSGLLTDAVAELADRGLLKGEAIGAYVFGGKDIDNLFRDQGARLAPVSETHDVARIGDLEGFVAINTALQVGLDGSVNVERIEGRLITGMGGHPDFCAAAARSSQGLSVIALRSTHRGTSTIVPRVETVSTPRCDVDVVVTEHGVADLRCVDDDQRAELLIDVAHPHFRSSLHIGARQIARGGKVAAGSAGLTLLSSSHKLTQ